MNYQTEPMLAVQIPIITLSDDSYIRLTLETFFATRLVHLLSGLDDDKPIHFHSREGASLTNFSGYTEWLSTTTPTLTLGWDWRLDVSQGHPIYVRLGAPRSNIMLVDTGAHDLGPSKTLVLLEEGITSLAWQEKVHTYIIARYAHN